MAPVSVRRAQRTEAGEISDLIVRLKRLNNEFDPLFGVVRDVKDRADKYVADSFGRNDILLLVAVSGKKVVGVIRAEIRQRLFYEPNTEGRITDMYILPEHRRKTLGEEMLAMASAELMRMGAEIIVGDLPSRNEIGLHFYTKRGFRRLVESYAKMPQ